MSETVMTPYFFQKHNGIYPVPDSVVNDAMAHAIIEYPNESAGICFGDKYYPIHNSAEDPTENFEISLEDQLAICQPHEVQAVFHSHPNGTEGPTVSDMVSQQSAGVPYGIIVFTPEMSVKDVIFYGDSVKSAPYEQRPFKPGVYDCYSLVRDYYKEEYAIALPDVPRDPEWWTEDDGPELLLENFAKHDFDTIDPRELKPGDGFLAKPFRTRKTCHCGVYVGNGVVLHHYGSERSQTLSCFESIYNVQRFITHYVRHKSMQPSATSEVTDGNDSE